MGFVGVVVPIAVVVVEADPSLLQGLVEVGTLEFMTMDLKELLG